MQHGRVRVGEIEVVALCDDVREGPWSLAEAFPDVIPDDWAEIAARYPGTAAADMWRARDHCFLVRTADRTILVDTGIGPAGTPVAEFLNPAGGALLAELAAAGVQSDRIDVVVNTHIHFDHIGWNVGGPVDEPRATFPNATYVIQEAEWDAFADDDDPRGKPARDRQVRWLREESILELVTGEREIADGVRLVPTPGHTAGSQSVAIGSGGELLLLSGDVANHPLQVSSPDRRSFADADPGLAAATRREVFGRAERERALVAPAHFPDPFGRIVDGRWEPAP